MNKPPLDKPRRSHLELAVTYTGEAWFPPLPGATERLTAILNAPGGVNRELLIAELKRDLAVVSALCRRLVATKSPGVPSLALLRTAPTDTLRALVQPDELTHSKHSFAPLQRWQGDRLVETAVAVTAAQTLSSAFEVESDLAFTCALLRQLGLSLLAWNYPHVFRRALGMVQDNGQLDSTLGKILGFTPTLLTLTLLRSRDASPVILRALGDTWVHSQVSENDMTLGEKLSSLCRLAESLAQSATRDDQDSSHPAWRASCASFEQHIGHNGWVILEQELSWYLSTYAHFGLEQAKPPPAIQALSGASSQHVAPLLAKLESKVAIRRCRPEMKRLITDFYLRAASPNGPSQAYRHLICNIVTRCGFSRGILFQRRSADSAFDSVVRSNGWPESLDAPAPQVIVERIRSAVVSDKVLQGEIAQDGTSWIAALMGPQGDALLYLEMPLGVDGATKRELLDCVEAFRAAAGLV